MKSEVEDLSKKIKACTLCLKHLVDGVNPVVEFKASSKIVLIGQAPGKVVHLSSKPWADKSGERLREWLAVTEEQFYDTSNFAIVPMGFCYPGKGKNGDLPPRKECAPEWHPQILKALKNVELKLLVGSYAQNYYVDSKHTTLTERVRHFHDYLPDYFPLPHPSPRNNIWMKKNDWFAADVLPYLKELVNTIVK
jgi:uracil-DNA glycosylase